MTRARAVSRVPNRCPKIRIKSRNIRTFIISSIHEDVGSKKGEFKLRFIFTINSLWSRGKAWNRFPWYILSAKVNTYSMKVGRHDDQFHHRYDQIWLNKFFQLEGRGKRDKIIVDASRSAIMGILIQLKWQWERPVVSIVRATMTIEMKRKRGEINQQRETCNNGPTLYIRRSRLPYEIGEAGVRCLISFADGIICSTMLARFLNENVFGVRCFSDRSERVGSREIEIWGNFFN